MIQGKKRNSGCNNNNNNVDHEYVKKKQQKFMCVAVVFDQPSDRDHVSLATNTSAGAAQSSTDRL